MTQLVVSLRNALVSFFEVMEQTQKQTYKYVLPKSFRFFSIPHQQLPVTVRIADNSFFNIYFLKNSYSLNPNTAAISHQTVLKRCISLLLFGENFVWHDIIVCVCVCVLFIYTMHSESQVVPNLFSAGVSGTLKSSEPWKYLLNPSLRSVPQKIKPC